MINNNDTADAVRCVSRGAPIKRSCKYPVPSVSGHYNARVCNLLNQDKSVNYNVVLARALMCCETHFHVGTSRPLKLIFFATDHYDSSAPYTGTNQGPLSPGTNY